LDSAETILLSRSDVAGLLDIAECIQAVESAFLLHAQGKTIPPKILGANVPGGGFHIKTGGIRTKLEYFVAKANANFPDNMKKHGLPTIQGVIIVCNAENGQLLAVMDSIEITIVRTGAATAVAAQYLSRPDSSVATICGCGNQGRISLKALLKVRNIELVYAFDSDFAQSEKYTEQFSKEHNIRIIPVYDLKRALRESDICITCTPSSTPLLFREDIRPGTFIAAVGADNEFKQEIDAGLIASCKLIADLKEQSATIGDFHHALTKGYVTMSHMHAELGEIIAGKKSGRTSDDEIIVFDSTGTGLQDVASAVIVYEKALQKKCGLKFAFKD